MSWEDIEDAVQSAVVLSSGFPDGQVSWSYQDIGERTLDHIVIKFGGEMVIGVDRLDTSYDATRAAGQEIKQEIKGVREVPLEIQCFTAAVIGSTAARRVCELVRTKLRLPDIRYRLKRVGISPFDLGPVSYVPDIPSVQFRGRATCTIRCYVPVQDCIEYTTYIERIRGTIIAFGGGTTAGIATGYSIGFDSLIASGATGFYPPG